MAAFSLVWFNAVAQKLFIFCQNFEKYNTDKLLKYFVGLGMEQPFCCCCNSFRAEYPPFLNGIAELAEKRRRHHSLSSRLLAKQ